MPQIMIHSCNQRKWYVEEYLVPSLQEQGITDIVVYNDDNEVGNLKAFLDSITKLDDTGGTWHLQDDVIICNDFSYRINEYEYGIACGFCSKYDDNKDPGDAFAKDMWYSFPCIRIPNQLAKKFRLWIYKQASSHWDYRYLVESGKYDDVLFHRFLELEYPYTIVNNISPNLVDHIDYLIGGTVINKIRPDKWIRAEYFNDLELIDKLERNLNESR